MKNTEYTCAEASINSYFRRKICRFIHFLFLINLTEKAKIHFLFLIIIHYFFKTRLDFALQANALADSKTKITMKYLQQFDNFFGFSNIFISLSVLLFWQDKTWFGLASQWCNGLEILDNFDTCESRFRFKHFFVSVVILAAHCTAQCPRQFCKEILCIVVVLRAKNNFKCQSPFCFKNFFVSVII